MRRGQKIFGVEKFKALLAAGSFTVLMSYVVRLSDSIIAGNMLGPDALAGVNLVGPCLSAISFVGSMIATGVGTHYSLAMGRCDVTRARQFFMQGVWSVLLLGGALAAAILLGREWFLGFFGASRGVTTFARGYMSWIWPVAILEGLQTLLVALGYADGDTKVCAASYAVVFVGNFVTSIVGVKLGLGTAGCAMGSVVAEAAGCLVMALHFMRRCNTFAIVRHFALDDTFRIVSASFGDAAAFLCDGVLFFFLNKFAVQHFGSHLLPIVGVATVLWGFLEFFNGIGVAVQPIVTVYYGEGNTLAIRRVMASALRVSVVEGVVFMAFFGIFPEAVVNLVGLREPAVVAQAIGAIRAMCVGFVALAFAGLFNSYYMFVERPLLAGCVTFLSYLIMPIVCVSVFSIWGVQGLWYGLGVGPFMGVALTSLIIVATLGPRMYPLLLPRTREAKMRVFNLALTEREIVETSRRVGEVPGVPMRAALLIEEVLMVVRERAKGRTLLGEVTLDLNEGVLLTLRDDGPIFDITDADAQISSLRSFLVASMMQAHDGRMNLVTTGFNRNVFRF